MPCRLSTRRSAESILSPSVPLPLPQGILDNQNDTLVPAPYRQTDAEAHDRSSSIQESTLHREIVAGESRNRWAWREALPSCRSIEQPLAWHGAGGMALRTQGTLAKKKGRTPEGVRPTRLTRSGVAVSVGLSWTARGRESADSKSSESRCHRCRRQSHSRMSEGPSPLQADQHSH